MNNSSGVMITLVVLSFLSCGNFQPDKKEMTQYFLIRHAEKAADGTDDPALSSAGQARALRLVNLLKEHKIDRLYATPYKRTQQTLQPLADTHHLKINIYDHQDPTSINRMIADCKGKTCVIVGHTNTIPHLANTLIGQQRYKELEESDYTKMWDILFIGDKVTRHKVLTY
jgi:phosphohistidine phosphatase SixA